MFVSTVSFAQEWNFSSPEFNSLTTISETTTINGLTIVASVGKTVTFDDNTKKLDGIDYTRRLKLGGSGEWADDNTPNTRVLSFPVSGNTKITIVCMSSSDKTDRKLTVASGSKTNVIGEPSAPGASLLKTVINYEGDATTIYVFSPSSGVNIYHIIAEASSPTSVKDNYMNMKVVAKEFFNLAGVNMGNVYDNLNPGIYICKTTYENGQIESSKVFKQKQ